MKRFSVVAIVVGLAVVGGACKKKAADTGTGSDGSGSAVAVGSDMGSAGAGSSMAAGSGSGSGSGSAMAAGSGSDTGSGSAAAGSGSGSAADTAFVTLISDETNGNHEADLKTAADKAVAQLPADIKDGKWGAHVMLKTLETGAKVSCSIEVDVFTQPDHAVFAPLIHSGEVTPEKGKEADAPGDCFEGVLDHAIVSEVAQAIADKKAGKPDPVGAGSADGSAAGSAAPAAGSGSAAKK